MFITWRRLSDSFGTVGPLEVPIVSYGKKEKKEEEKKTNSTGTLWSFALEHREKKTEKCCSSDITGIISAIDTCKVGHG